MRPSRLRRVAPALGVVLAAAALLLVPLPDQYRARWLAKLLDLGHLPLFALVTWGFASSLGGREWLAFAAAVALAAAFELLQLVTGRNAEPGDVLYAALGGLLVVSFARERRILWRAAAVMAAVGWTAVDAVPPIADAWLAWRAFPVVSDFRSPWEPHRWRTESAELAREAGGPGGPGGPGGRFAGRLTLLPADGASGAVLFPVRADWSGYSRLVWEFHIEDEPLELLFSIRDGRRVEPPQVRFDLVRTYPPGRQRVVIDLEQLARGSGPVARVARVPHVAPLDLSRIQSVHVIAPAVQAPRRVWLERIVLE